MNTSKKLPAVLLVTSALLVVTACGNNAANQKTSANNHNHSTSAPAVAAVAPSSNAAASNSSKAAPASYKYGKLKIQALSGAVCGAPSYVAYEKGFFAEEGLDVELVSGSMDAMKTGLTTGEFTVTNGDFVWFTSIQQGLDLKVIGGLHHGCIKLVVPPGSDIKTAADLKGKRIGVDEIGGVPMAVASVVVTNAGLDPQKDVQWLAYPLDQLQEGVKKGEIDVYAAWDPFGKLAEVNNGYTVLADISTDSNFAGKSCCFLYASGKQIEEDPERVAAIARAYQKATAWIAEHPEETAKLEIEKKYVATDDVKLVTDLIESYHFNYTTDAAQEDIRYFVKQFSKTGFLKKDTDPDEFLKKAYYDVFK
ncbi:ABC transporter substrate-binding protein [Paenibacillus borealis]|uniref:ABC transporter substrate-binding protein n=1 Tax=Paenibacillus borealis TaxID=160799 RepID=A0A089MRF7_PAEBO|nr:ABC transporter substrate-binding protein [Paenibacillus borealis]AIQ59074.1 ABC transporter substrate-binding protein [Paenibacillus borealis]